MSCLVASPSTCEIPPRENPPGTAAWVSFRESTVLLLKRSSGALVVSVADFSEATFSPCEEAIVFNAYRRSRSGTKASIHSTSVRNEAETRGPPRAQEL